MVWVGLAHLKGYFPATERLRRKEGRKEGRKKERPGLLT